MPIRIYAGPATLSVENREAAVTAHLRTRRAEHGGEEWSGQLRGSTDGLLWDAMRAPDVRLRIHGREGAAVIESPSAPSGWAKVRGIGPVPF